MKTAPFLLTFNLLFGLGCDRGTTAPVPAPRAAGTRPAAVAPRVEPLSDRLSHAGASRVVALGDLHGDLAATRRALRLAGAIDTADHWNGDDLVVVQTGDVLDRGDDDRAVFDLLERLRHEATRAGGALILLSGNHELMNVARDFRYVTPRGFSDFAHERGRGAAFQPGGPYAAILASRPIVARVGDTLFVHGGILPKHVAYGLDRMNDGVRAWILGQRPEPPPIVMADDGPVWTRRYSADPGPADCAVLSQVLAALGSQRMVVGHTPQRSGITSACAARVWRIDVGMSKFYGGPVEVLEIQNDVVSVRREDV